MKRYAMILILIGGLCAAAHAAVPSLLNYQGLLKESGAAVTGTKSITFNLYDAASGGTLLCSSGAQSITVTSGLFSYKIGSAGCDLSAIDWDAVSVYLELVIESTTISPREQITGAAYSLDTKAANVSFTPAGDLAATDAQTAIEELDTEKFSVTGGVVSGPLTVTSDIITAGGITAATGTITAAAFSGDGSALTGVSATGGVLKTGDTMSGDLIVAADIITSGSITAATGTVTAAAFSGDGSALTGVVSVGSVADTGDTMSGDLTVAANIITSGNITAATGTIIAASFSGDGSTLTGVTATDNTKVAKTGDVMSGSLDVNGDLTVSGGLNAATGTVTAQDALLSGNATAAYFFGDGSNLTGVSATDNTKVAKTGDVMSGSLDVNGDLTVSGGLNAATGTVTAQDASLSGNATAAYFFGNGSNLTGVSATDNTKVSKTGDVMSGSLDVNGDLTVSGGLNAATGTVTAQDALLSGNATAAYFFGDGSNLTNVSGTDNTKVSISGDTMTGDLHVNASILASGDVTAATGTMTAQDAIFSGNATAAYFFGDGSNLTGISASDNTRVSRSGDYIAGSLGISDSAGATSTISVRQLATTNPAVYVETMSPTNAQPALYVNTEGTGNIAQFAKSNSAKFVVDNNGNVYASGTIDVSGVVYSAGDIMTGALGISDVSGATSAISVRQVATTNPAAYIETKSPTNAQPALYVNTDGTGNIAQFAQGNFAKFVVDNSGNVYASGTIDVSGVVYSAGDIMTGALGISDVSGATSAISVRQVATTNPAAYIETKSPTNAQPALYVNTDGTGNIAQFAQGNFAKFVVDNSGNVYASGTIDVSGVVYSAGDIMTGALGISDVSGATSAISVRQVATTNPAAYIETKSPTNAQPALYVNTDGTGNIAQFAQGNFAKFVVDNSGNVYASGTIEGLGTIGETGGVMTGSLAIGDSTGATSSLSVRQLATTNPSAYIETVSPTNAQPAIYVNTMGTGNIAQFAQGNATKFYIDNDGNIFASGTVDGMGIVHKYGDTMDGALGISDVAGATSSLSVRQWASANPAIYAEIKAPANNNPVMYVNTDGGGHMALLAKSNAPKFVVDNTGNVYATGTVAAQGFAGDGSALQGVVKKAGDAMAGALSVQNANPASGTIMLTNSVLSALIEGDASGGGPLIALNSSAQPKFFVGNDGSVLASGTVIVLGNIAATGTIKGGCPAGMAPMTDYCIDMNTGGAPLDWTIAVTTCLASGKRLCSAAEWVGACNVPPPGITGISDANGEWVDDLDNGTNAIAMGAGSCATIESVLMTNNTLYYSRCCANR